MAYVSENQIKEKILNRENFKGSSVKGVAINNDYIVYSYDTVIYRESDEYFDNKKYSATTSKLQNILIDCFNFNNGVKKRDAK